MKRVTVEITSKIVGANLVFPYEHDLQASILPVYKVPLYEVNVDHVEYFQAIRFGLRGLINPWPKIRRCNAGIIGQPPVEAWWNAIYSPHSTPGEGTPGGIGIRSDHVYIHEGAPIGRPAGTLGCVEISGGSAWSKFLRTLTQRTGSSYLGNALREHKVIVIVQSAAPPEAKLVGRVSLFPPPATLDIPANWMNL